ncbi:hypothetical protein MMC13_000987 [Lambiella insularis]|nr:hypothetical protein [Lambiella insularis]
MYRGHRTDHTGIKTSTHTLVVDEKLEPTSAPGRSAHASSTAPDVPYEKDSSKSITKDIEERQAKPSSDYAELDEYPTGARLVFIVLALVLSIFLVSLDLKIVATAIPRNTDDFHGLNDVSWYSAAFFATIVRMGKAYKYFPLKGSFLASIFIFELGSLICSVPPNSTTLIVGRAVAGLGAAGIGSGTYTIIAFSAAPKRQPMFTGILGTSYGIAAVVGPLISRTLADKVSWQWCFYINLPIGAVSAFIILLFFETPRSAKHKSAALCEKVLQMDLVGVSLVMGAIISYILALHYGGQTYAWNSSQVVGLLVGFIVLLASFTAWERCQEDRAMVPFRLAGDRVYLVSSHFAFFFSGAYFLTIYILPIYFQVIDNVSAAMSGVRNLPLILAVTISMLSSGAYTSITGIAAPIVVVGTAIGTINIGLLYTLDICTEEGKWIPIITIQATAPAADLAEVTAILLFLQIGGGAFMVSAAQTAFINVLVKAIPYSAPGIDPATVVNTGATDLRSVFSLD